MKKKVRFKVGKPLQNMLPMTLIKIETRYTYTIGIRFIYELSSIC